jgi:hypothetical protein
LGPTNLRGANEHLWNLCWRDVSVETGRAGGEDHSTNQHKKSEDDEGKLRVDGVFVHGWD